MPSITNTFSTTACDINSNTLQERFGKSPELHFADVNVKILSITEVLKRLPLISGYLYCNYLHYIFRNTVLYKI